MKVSIHKNEILVGKKRVPLLSGEVHYWRLNPNCWKDVLARVREMGLEVVSTYIPWDFHEHKRGSFDFTGKTDPARNLKRFLDLTRKEGFWLVIRPGPYIYSEWPNDGVPDYAYKYHRLHPKFLAYAQNYLKRVVKVLQPYFATRRGGHILLLQADNEIDPWPDLFGHQYGLNSKPGLFQDYLKTLYDKDIKDLNQCWGTDYGSFKEAGAFIATMLPGETGLALKGDRELSRNLDYLKFKYFYSLKYAQWSVEAYKKLGVDVPIYLNLYPFFYAHDWKQMQSVSDLVGIDLYPTGEMSEDRFEQRKFIDKVRYLKSFSKLPFIAEFASGVWHSRHYETGVLTPNHYRLICLSALLGGIKGWNWYMLVNRDNWYMSPINEWGRVHDELYDVFKQMVSVFKKVQAPSLTKLTDVAVTFNPLQYAARTLSHNSPILVSLYESDIDYELYDPRNPSCDKKVLFYSGNQWLEPESQKNLKRYVERGGTLVAFRDYPRKDDRFQNCSLVGFEEPTRILFEFKRKLSVKLAAGRKSVELNSSVFTFDRVKGQNITADLGPYGKHVVGYVKKIGKGRIIHLGLEPTRELVLEILNYLEIPLFAYSTTRDIKTALFKRNKRHYLVVVNNGEEDKSASIHIPALIKRRQKLKSHHLLDGKQETLTLEPTMPLSVDIPRKDGKVFELTT